jgi:hypothetical protein
MASSRSADKFVDMIHDGLAEDSNFPGVIHLPLQHLGSEWPSDRFRTGS